MTESRLQATGLTRSFFRKGRDRAGDFAAVSNVNLALRAGELVGLMGRSGSGKSTLLNMFAGLLAPTEGTVLLDGKDIYALDDEERSRLRNARIGVIPQGNTVLHNLSVVQNVMLPQLMYSSGNHVGAGAAATEDKEHGESVGSGGAAETAEQRAMRLLETLGIAGLADAYPRELSGGEARRVAIARALANDPDVVLADEPTGDLDNDNTKLVLDLLRERADHGSTVLLVTHEQEVERVADRMLTMSAGVLESA